MNDFLSYSKNKQALLTNAKIFSVNEQNKILKAISLAEKFHAGQGRDEGDIEEAGYVIHCIRAARWLTEQGINNISVIIATILHDILEDTKISSDEIKNHFGNRVFNLVAGVTRPRLINESEEDKKQTKPLNYNKILKDNKHIRLIKTADLLDNMRSWQYIPLSHPSQQKFSRWEKEAEQFYIPIAQSVNNKAAEEMRIILKKFKRTTL